MVSPVDAVVDTSALIAILLREDDALIYLDALARIPRWGIAAPNRSELQMVATARLQGDGAAIARQLLERCRIVTLAVDTAQADAAVSAYQRFGKGRHPASLNFGDCFAYALARQHDVPLLFKGDDFAQTDIARVS